MSATTPLCDIAFKYGTDKCPQLKHAYTPYYYEIFKDKQKTVKKVLELGIGHYKGMDKNEWVFDPGLNRNYHRGASLYMWRDFFPNALIYGADRVPEAIFQDQRIATVLVDERNKLDLENLIRQTGSDIDIFIDDASHKVSDQIFAARVLLPLLNDNITYIIEDVGRTKEIMNSLGDLYNYHIPPIPRKWKGGMLLVITKQKTA